MKSDLLVTLADKNYIDQAKQLFSSAYWNAGWAGDYMLLSHEIPDEDLKWFRDKGILIKRCKVFYDKKGSNWPIVFLNKFYLFTPEFKKWKNIVYLDSDIIVRASLDELTKIKEFAATCSNKLGDQFIINVFTNSESKKTKRKLFKEIKKNYNLNETAYSAGVIAFNTDIIKDDTFYELQKLINLYGEISRSGDQPIFNLFFYKKITALPHIYNCWTDYMINSCNIRPEKIKAIILHFIARNKPWLPNSPFYKEWKDNLDKGELIDLKRIPPPREHWTEEDINNYYLYLRKRHILYFHKHIIWKISLFIDEILGLLGIYLKNNFPKLYVSLKKIKNGKSKYFSSHSSI